MARYDLPDEAWIIIQPLLPVEPISPGPDAHGLSIVKLSTVCSGCCVPVPRGVIYLNDMDHGKRFITALIGGQNQV